ncbi:MAG: hypothetical protein QM520_04425 [Gammaproteobacteria bacterium]|nr:hypothetical protein [Gammaproteobacteria bacterium]
MSNAKTNFGFNQTLIGDLVTWVTGNGYQCYGIVLSDYNGRAVIQFTNANGQAAPNWGTVYKASGNLTVLTQDIVATQAEERRLAGEVYRAGEVRAQAFAVAVKSNASGFYDTDTQFDHTTQHITARLLAHPDGRTAVVTASGIEVTKSGVKTSIHSVDAFNAYTIEHNNATGFAVNHAELERLGFNKLFEIRHPSTGLPASRSYAFFGENGQVATVTTQLDSDGKFEISGVSVPIQPNQHIELMVENGVANIEGFRNSLVAEFGIYIRQNTNMTTWSAIQTRLVDELGFVHDEVSHTYYAVDIDDQDVVIDISDNLQTARVESWISIEGQYFNGKYSIAELGTKLGMLANLGGYGDNPNTSLYDPTYQVIGVPPIAIAPNNLNASTGVLLNEGIFVHALQEVGPHLSNAESPLISQSDIVVNLPSYVLG